MTDEIKIFNVNKASFSLDKDPIIHFASVKKETMKIHARHDNDFIYDTKKNVCILMKTVLSKDWEKVVLSPS